MTAKQRYEDAHRDWFASEYPTAYASGRYCKAKQPATAKANGLTQFVINFLNWRGHRATRVSSAGRIVGNRFIKSTTRKGTADVSATINGLAVMLEVKVGKDRPSPEQLAEQAKERKAGGMYEFIQNPDQFLQLYDQITKAHQ
jgi:hypothetical protein